MESLLIFIAIFVIDALIKSRKKKQQQLPRQNSTPIPKETEAADYEDEEELEQNQAPKSLQDLIRQFEEQQRDSSQGTYVPPEPPIEEVPSSNIKKDISENDIYLIAKNIIGYDFLDIDFLMIEFELDKEDALKIIEVLQKRHIIGQEDADGEFEILVHDLKKIEVIFSHKHVQEQNKAQSAIETELERQRKLNELEERARQVRENAGTDFSSSPEEPQKTRVQRISKNIADIRRGFIWAKVIDEPRFKKRWSARSR